MGPVMRVIFAIAIVTWASGPVHADCGVATDRMPTFSAPVDGRIDSGMGLKPHPLLGLVRLHTGVDFVRAIGTPVRAAASGRIILAGYTGEHGNRIDIAHADDLTTLYAHMSRIAVAVDACVATGQVIGWIGNTGLSAEPHLHFEIRKSDQPVDPETLLPPAPPR